jgi:superfamily II DNA or RNA helicase
MPLDALNLDTDYHTGKGDLAESFYRPCLNSATRYDRAAGYFRSSVLELVGDAFARFAQSGGVARLICSPHLTEEDAKAAIKAYDYRSEFLADHLNAELASLLTTARSARAVELFATLIRLRALDVRIALRPTHTGLYHEKLGIFEDVQHNRVTFRGSANESRNAWDPSANFESFEVFCSWTSSREAARCARHVDYFNSLWDGDVDGVHISPLPQAFHSRLLQYSTHDLTEFTAARAPTRISRRPMEHQRDAIAAWAANGSRGILKHATGSGKTFTAITAMRSHVESHQPVLVVVPSVLLLKQWAQELRDEFPDVTLLVCGGGSNRWKSARRLRAFTRPAVKSQRIALSTMQTAASDLFRRDVFAGDHLMLVADEVHQLGSPVCRRLLTLRTGSRLGLSATPERYGDEEGTAAVLEYFGGIVKPVVTLADAIKAGRLVPYQYFPHPVDLTATELDAWSELSERIAKLFARRHATDSAGAKEDTQLSLLLIQRSRIAKMASGKTALARDVLAENVQGSERWLVYCENSNQLEQVRDAISFLPHRVLEYHSAMSGARDETLQDFRYYGGILLSIRCLDEGVDIPEISHALILASSQNPRQFIQRRGRVLRKAPHKNTAVVHDTLVLPPNDDQVRGLPSLVMAEVARSIEFAQSALNGSGITWLRKTLIDRGWDAAELLQQGDEEVVEET